MVEGYSLRMARVIPGLPRPSSALMAIFASASLLASEPVVPVNSQRNASWIVQGKAASTVHFPWMASLYVGSAEDPENGGACGGALIAPGWILTAAHCFLNKAGTSVDLTSASRTKVTLRSDTIEPLQDSAEEYTVKNLIVHSAYNPDADTSDNENDSDIALIEINGTSSQTVMQLLGSSPVVLDDLIGTVAGWGKLGSDAASSNVLLQTDLKVTSNSSCNTRYAGGITEKMVCAGGINTGDKNDTCQGDSGGPLFLNQNGRHLQIGIVSFGGTLTGPPCGDPDSPGVYTRVSLFKGFIQETVPAAQFVELQASGATQARFDSLPVIAGYSSAKTLSAARFSGGLTRDNGQTFQSSASGNDFVRIMGQITPVAGDIGATSDIYIVERKDGVFYMKTVDGVFVPWTDGKISSLVPAVEGVILSARVQVDVYANSKLARGDHRVYFGYTGIDGRLHYNLDPVRIIIE